MLVPRTTHAGNNLKKLRIDAPFQLESGEIINGLEIGYHTYGELNTDKSNVIWVLHALTGNSDPADWWAGLVGDDDLITPKKYFIICVNMLGSCYGTSTLEKHHLITIRDIVNVNRLVYDHYGLGKIRLGIGGSMGGQQLLQWAVDAPEVFENIVPIATNAEHSPWGIAFNEAQRMAMEHPDAGKGVEIARAIGMLSYRNHRIFNKMQKDTDCRADDFRASSYQRYQGKKLKERFDPVAYHHLSKSMDSHNIGRYYGDVETALSRITSKCVSIGIPTDLLFPVEEQQRIAAGIAGAVFREIDTVYGHDGFLVDTDQVCRILTEELEGLF